MPRKTLAAVVRCCGVILAAVLCLAPALGVEFRKLPLDSPPTCLAVTESGERLVVGQEVADRLTVWDMKTGEAVKQIACPSPRSILCRGDQVFVANYGKGTISVFSLKDWELVDEVQAGENNVYYLSAPQGKNFKGNLIAVADGGAKPHSYRVTLVDTKKDQHRELFGEVHLSVATVDYEGKVIVCQSSFDHSPSGTVIKVLDYAKTARIKPAPEADDPRTRSRPNTPDSLGVRGLHKDTPLLMQTAPGQFWFGSEAIWKGMPPAPEGADRGDFIMADATRKQFFVFSSDSVKCVSLQSGFTELGSQPLSYPADEADDESDKPAEQPKSSSSKKSRKTTRSHTSPAKKPKASKQPLNELFHDVAVTLGDQVSFVHFDHASHSLLFASTTLFKGSAPAAASAETLDDAYAGDGASLPPRVVIGKALVRKLFGETAHGKFVVMNGPVGFKVSDSGDVNWTPTKAELGKQQIKLKATIDGKTSFVRLTTEVIELDDAALTGDPSDLADAGRHELNEPQFTLAYAADGQGMLLLDGNTVRVLDKAGMGVKSSHQFDRRYLRFQERPEYYVALAPKSLELIDKKTWKTIKEIPLDYPQLQDLAVNPAEKFSYVTLPGKGGLGIDETTGKIEPFPQLIGQGVSIDAQGHRLYSIARQAYQNGFRIDARAHRIMPSYGTAEALLCYDIRGRVPRGESLNASPGQNGRRITVSPDGKHVAYVSGGGAVGANYAIQAFTAEDVAHESARYQIAAYPVDMTFHPSIDMVACTNGKKIWFSRRSTGESLDAVIDSAQSWDETSRILFAPSGTQLMIGFQAKGRQRVLQSVALKLKPDDLTIAQKGYLRPALVPRIKDPGPRTQPEHVTTILVKNLTSADIEALEPAGNQELTVKEIFRKYGDAIVDIRTESGSGTGFFVGSKGYILTCAHVVDDAKTLSVHYRPSGDAQQPTTDVAKLIGLDNRLDLALLKIVPKAPLHLVHLAGSGTVEAGEAVTVIGNPGLGAKILNQTVTTGVVSSPERQFDGVAYIQLSAAVNPGNSGGPMFNNRGEVIGVISAKARIESTGFAVPIYSVLSFLGQSPPGSTPAKRSTGDLAAAGKAPEPAEAAAPKTTSDVESGVQGEELRVWSSAAGKKSIEAALVKVEDGVAYLRRKDGKILKIAVKTLSPADQEFVKGK